MLEVQRHPNQQGGFKQNFGTDFFASYWGVTRVSTIRILCALSAQYWWELTAMDVETAYLQAPLRDGVEVYMYQP